jgi:hypothetical protein
VEVEVADVLRVAVVAEAVDDQRRHPCERAGRDRDLAGGSWSQRISTWRSGASPIGSPCPGANAFMGPPYAIAPF